MSDKGAIALLSWFSDHTSPVPCCPPATYSYPFEFWGPFASYFKPSDHLNEVEVVKWDFFFFSVDWLGCLSLTTAPSANECWVRCGEVGVLQLEWGRLQLACTAPEWTHPLCPFGGESSTFTCMIFSGNGFHPEFCLPRWSAYTPFPQSPFLGLYPNFCSQILFPGAQNEFSPGDKEETVGLLWLFFFFLNRWLPLWPSSQLQSSTC